jgi:hypothetical protein
MYTPSGLMFVCNILTKTWICKLNSTKYNPLISVVGYCVVVVSVVGCQWHQWVFSYWSPAVSVEVNGGFCGC